MEPAFSILRRLSQVAVFIFSACLLTTSACSRFEASVEGLDGFATEFRQANQASTVDSLLALYELEGCDDRTLSMLKAALIYELGLPIKRITFEPLSGAPEEAIDYEHDGVRYGPSLTPSQRMRVEYAEEDQFTSLFSIGQTSDGTWRIVSARPVPKQ
ncbi:MAG: hypothetical protein NWT02_08090 [Opitutales bacterium]|jgi:hypothetical protein|nr:hypothetical protein [Opitutales bacterium]MDP4643315.1 hypothetical protein [Opitutales bacterium]MDP4694567.1 hypothetical protein [Opitutales bacterium]MDP4777709.1 hypothetical protein [Opitutales bacterium]MDP4880461.1 hypothetical protein [Opitutales bacterium]